MQYGLNIGHSKEVFEEEYSKRHQSAKMIHKITENGLISPPHVEPLKEQVHGLT